MISFEKNLEAEYKGEIDLRTEEVARLQAEVNMKSKQNDELKMIVGRLEIDCTELKTEKESMQIDAARLESQYEKGAFYNFIDRLIFGIFEPKIWGSLSNFCIYEKRIIMLWD